MGQPRAARAPIVFFNRSPKTSTLRVGEVSRELPDAVWMDEKSSGSFDSAPVSLKGLNILEALRSG